jgi:hypothetical protein
MAPAPRDIYENDVDFVALASQDPAFAKKYFIPAAAGNKNQFLRD